MNLTWPTKTLRWTLKTRLIDHAALFSLGLRIAPHLAKPPRHGGFRVWPQSVPDNLTGPRVFWGAHLQLIQHYRQRVLISAATHPRLKMSRLVTAALGPGSQSQCIAILHAPYYIITPPTHLRITFHNAAILMRGDGLLAGGGRALLFLGGGDHE